MNCEFANQIKAGGIIKKSAPIQMFYCPQPKVLQKFVSAHK